MAGGILDEARKRLPDEYVRDYSAYGGISNARLPYLGGRGQAAPTPEQECIAAGGTWDPVNNVCIMPDGDMVAPEVPIYEDQSGIQYFSQWEDPARAALNTGYGLDPTMSVADANRLGYTDEQIQYATSPGSPYDPYDPRNPNYVGGEWYKEQNEKVRKQEEIGNKIKEVIGKLVANSIPIFGGIIAEKLGLTRSDIDKAGGKTAVDRLIEKNIADYNRSQPVLNENLGYRDDTYVTPSGREVQSKSNVTFRDSDDDDRTETQALREKLSDWREGKGTSARDKATQYGQKAKDAGLTVHQQSLVDRGLRKASDFTDDTVTARTSPHTKRGGYGQFGNLSEKEARGAQASDSAAKHWDIIDRHLEIKKQKEEGTFKGYVTDSSGQRHYSFADGGDVPHPGGPMGTDTVPAWLTEGEFVVDRDSAQRFGPMLEQINDWEPYPGTIEGGMSDLDNLINSYARGGKVK